MESCCLLCSCQVGQVVVCGSSQGMAGMADAVDQVQQLLHELLDGCQDLRAGLG
jgi:hypothetical protein